MRSTAFMVMCLMAVAVCHGEKTKIKVDSGGSVAKKPQVAPALATHGVGGSREELIRFLEQGFGPNVDRTKLPPKPVEKTQLAIDAMGALAAMRANEAVPVLMKIAGADLPPGVAQLMEEDLSKTRPESQSAFREKALRLLRYNAVVALGVMGNRNAIPVIQQALGAEPSIAARIQYVLALASLGDSSGVDYLVQVIGMENRRESAAAAQAFFLITGQDLGYTDATPVRLRRERARKYKDWWKANRGSFKADAQAVLQRRANPPGEKPFEPRNTRDLVKLSTYYFDFDNKMRSRDARERLQRAGRAISPDLQKIAMDPAEDIDVRLEAMNWLCVNSGEEARSIFKKLKRDENPEIAEKAQVLIDDLDNGNVPMSATMGP